MGIVENLLHSGNDTIAFDTAAGTEQVQVDVKPAAVGYRFQFSFHGVDTIDGYTFTSDPVTNQPKSITELAGNY